MSDLRRVRIESLTDNVIIYLPITPFITFKESMNSTSQDLFGFGEVDSGSTAKLDTWSAESFFPCLDNEYPFDISYEKHSPSYYVELLSKWMKEQHKLEFWYYSDDDPQNIIYNYYCKIVEFSHGEKYGNKDVYYTLNFREYKQLELNNSNIDDSTDVIQSYGGTYTVSDGDTLPTIAAKVYGDSTKWEYLMTLNGLSNPLNITAGKVLQL